MGIAKRYPGVYAAMATPLTAEGEIDPVGIGKVVDYLFEGGVTGLSILGSTGEGPALTIGQRQRALEATLEATKGRGAVFSGAASSTVSDVIAGLKTMAGSGAEGALVPPPYYYRIEADAMATYFERIAEASPVPIILYNIPPMTKLQIAPEAVARVATHPNVMGIKDSGGDLGYFATISRLTADIPGFTRYTGSDELLAATLTLGGHGIIGGAVNLVPDVLAEIYRAYGEGDVARAVALAGTVARANAAVRAVGTFPAAIKGQYALKGLCGPHTAAPVPTLTDAELATLRERMEAADLLKVPAGSAD